MPDLSRDHQPDCKKGGIQRLSGTEGGCPPLCPRLFQRKQKTHGGATEAGRASRDLSSYAEQLQMDLFYVGKSSEVLHGFIVDTAQRISCKTLAIIFDPGYPWFTMQEQIKYFVSAEAKVILISSQKREELESLVDLVFHFPGTGTSMDEVFYYVFMSIFSMEYRKRYIDSWYFSND